jgi:LmbE family N-acetylglucosaminyl deacetylase
LFDGEDPDVVLAQWPIDRHRDHRAVSLLALDGWMGSGQKAAYSPRRALRKRRNDLKMVSIVGGDDGFQLRTERIRSGRGFPQALAKPQQLASSVMLPKILSLR